MPRGTFGRRTTYYADPATKKPPPKSEKEPDLTVTQADLGLCAKFLNFSRVLDLGQRGTVDWASFLALLVRAKQAADLGVTARITKVDHIHSDLVDKGLGQAIDW